MMVVLMLMSTQMYNFMGVEEEKTSLETVDDTPARTAYQQFYQAEGPTAGATQGQPAAKARLPTHQYYSLTQGMDFSSNKQTPKITTMMVSMTSMI